MFYMCFVDLVAESLVSCKAIIDGGIWKYVTRFCRRSIAVLSKEASQIMMYDFGLLRTLDVVVVSVYLVLGE